MIVYLAPTPAGTSGMSGLDFSLKPPKIVRNLVSKAVRAVGIKATVPTPAGPIVVDSRDPEAIKRAAEAARDAIARTTITVGPNTPAAPGAVATAQDFVENSIPGGWLTVIGGGVVLALAIAAMTSKKKAR